MLDSARTFRLQSRLALTLTSHSKASLDLVRHLPSGAVKTSGSMAPPCSGAAIRGSLPTLSKGPPGRRPRATPIHWHPCCLEAAVKYRRNPARDQRAVTARGAAVNEPSHHWPDRCTTCPHAASTPRVDTQGAGFATQMRSHKGGPSVPARQLRNRASVRRLHHLWCPRLAASRPGGQPWQRIRLSFPVHLQLQDKPWLQVYKILIV